MKITSSYLNPVFTPEGVKRICQLAKLVDIKCDGWVVTGNSGVSIANSVSLATKKPWMLLRKFDETCASSLLREGFIQGKRYVFIDDLIHSGETVNRVMRCVPVVGVVLYTQNDNDWMDWISHSQDKWLPEKIWVMEDDFADKVNIWTKKTWKHETVKLRK